MKERVKKNYPVVARQNFGFSVIEVMVVIFIVFMALGALLELLTFSFRAADFSRDDLIAAGLAQEGMEIVRYVRDKQNIWNTWYDGFPDNTQIPYNVQYDDNDLGARTFSDNQPLSIDSDGFYNYGSGQATPFYRKVILTKRADLAYVPLEVEVEVKWQYQGQPRYLRAYDLLYNWQ